MITFSSTFYQIFKIAFKNKREQNLDTVSESVYGSILPFQWVSPR